MWSRHLFPARGFLGNNFQTDWGRETQEERLMRSPPCYFFLFQNITAEGCLHLGSHSWTTGWHSKGQQPTCWDDRRWKRAQVLAESWNYWVNSGTTYLWILCSINHQCHDDHYVGQHSMQQWPAILMEIYIPMPRERNQSGWKATHLAGDHFASWWGGFSYGWSQPRGNGQFFAIYGYHFYYCFIKIISLFFA